MFVFHRTQGLIRCLVIDGGRGDGEWPGSAVCQAGLWGEEIVVEDETLI